MAGEAKMTMFLNSGLTESEQERVERLDSPVASILFRAGITRRFIWEGVTKDERRFIAFGKLMVPDDEFARASDDEFLAAFQTAVNSGRM